MDLTAILHAASQQSASDVHLDAALSKIYVRTAGRLQVLKNQRIEPTALQNWLLAQLDAAQRALFDAGQQFDFAHFETSLDLRTRVTVYFTQNGLTVAIRLLRSQAPSLASLGAPKFLSEVSPFSHGLVLITGPTGSGKSTTLASYLEHINQHYPAHIVTLEDPIEYPHANHQCLFHQMQHGVHFDNYADALHRNLRQDPDVIVVGELRDLASIEMALRAAETGHLVVATLHSSNAASAITRLIDVFDDANKSFIRQVLATVLLGVVAQRLVSTHDTAQRVATFETLIANAAVKNMIKESKEAQLPNLMQTHAKQGMFTFTQHYQKLLDTGLVVDSMPQWLGQ